MNSLPCIAAGQEEDWELPASSSMQTYNTLSDVPCQDDGVYWMPSSSNESAVDSLRQPSTLFQMSVAATHSINATGLSKAAQQLLSSDPELIYVVPPDMFQRCDLVLSSNLCLAVHLAFLHIRNSATVIQ